MLEDLGSKALSASHRLCAHAWSERQGVVGEGHNTTLPIVVLGVRSCESASGCGLLLISRSLGSRLKLLR